MTDLKVGDKYSVNAFMMPGAKSHVVEIIKLTTTEVHFLVSGENVEHPEKPREMPILAFVKWLEYTKV